MKKQFVAPLIASLFVLLSACHEVQNSNGSSSIIGDQSNSGSNLPAPTATPFAVESPAPIVVATPTPTPVATPTPLDVTSTHLNGTWGTPSASGTDYVTIATDGTFTSSLANVCNQSGAITSFAATDATSGTLILNIDTISSSDCFAVGTHSCNYVYTAAHNLSFPSPFPGFPPMMFPVPASFTLSCDSSPAANFTPATLPDPSATPTPTPPVFQIPAPGTPI